MCRGKIGEKFKQKRIERGIGMLEGSKKRVRRGEKDLKSRWMFFLRGQGENFK